jgi:pyruvate/oxaloacetate carboxyltransferase
MSAPLSQLEGRERAAECVRHEVAMGMKPLIAFVVQVKCGSSVITEFAAMGVDSLSLAAEYAGLKGPGQYLRVIPAARKEEPFPVAVARHELAQAALRGPIPEAEAIAADLARNVDKGERLARLNDAHALDLQVQLSGYIGNLS